MDSARINAIIEECPRKKVWADIGCDHGFTSAGLLAAGKADKVIAADVSAPSLAKAQAYRDKLGIAEKFECRLGDGLKVLKSGEANGIIISGMGAPLMVRILNDDIDVAKSADVLVLSAHNYHDRLRRFLVENGWKIVRERFVQEAGKHYVIMCAVEGQATYTEREYLFGKKEISSLERREYLLHEQEVILKNIEEIVRGGADASEKIAYAAMLREELDDKA